MLTALRALFHRPSITERLEEELLEAMEKHRRSETTSEEKDALLGVVVAATRLAGQLEATVHLPVSDVACKCSDQEATASP